MTFSRKDTNKSARGAQAERLAEQFLQGQGLVCIERNYRCAVGEIDLIMRRGGCGATEASLAPPPPRQG